MKIAIVGVTGLVGKVILRVLEERKFPVYELIPVASDRSVGELIVFNDKKIPVIGIEEAIDRKPDIAIFSAGSSLSLNWAEKFAETGSIVIDNSSAWRMDPDKKLIIPEINANSLSKKDRIIANPNCSTIQLLMVVNPLHIKYKVKRIVVSTYQSVTGSGNPAKEQMINERAGIKGEMAFPWPIDLNCLPHCDTFLENGYTTEEMKLLNETRKILDDDSINLTATAVRVPVIGGHSESVNIEFNEEYVIDDVMSILNKTPGVIVMDDFKNNIYPMPLISEGKDDVFVGRIRRDESQANSLNLWIVSDNLRKGAATNAIQIAEYLVEMGFI